MPLDSNHTLHAWMKYYQHDQSTDRMPTEPEKHYLLGFPGVEAEHPKWYIRRLWLVAEDDRIPFPKFLDKDVRELAEHVNKVVNTFVKDEDKRHEELCGGVFLEKDAVRILNYQGFGLRIWGEGSEAETRLKSNLPGPRPRWGVNTDSGYENNDEDNIRLNLRCWMAARIQAKTNAPCKEKKRVPSVTVEHIEQILPQFASQSRQQRPELAQQEGSAESSSELASAPSRSEHHTRLFVATVGAKLDSNRASTLARSDGSDDSWPLMSFTHSGSEADFTQSKSNQTKRPRIDIPTRRPRTRSRQQNAKSTSTAGANLLSDASTNITTPDVCNNNNNNTDVDDDGLSWADQTKRKLQLDLTRFLNSELDYAGILREVIPPTRQLYTLSPYRKPYSDMEVEFRNFSRALDHWESLITRLTASAGATQPPLEDPLKELAAQGTFEDRVVMLHNFGPRSHIDFPLEKWTISLALFFEGLLGDIYMPLPFEDLVIRLRAANQSLYDSFAVVSDRTRGGRDVG
ncbi:hypothetical protein BKA66DRAFT_285924 [Pyrenochaeta sp. MPI-SDFR-AT-0127]|nr:hypothetical protein BKA66DRAFT_285924 [Pyrenochaeta sp. MPI-SDFR-AT-0127]